MTADAKDILTESRLRQQPRALLTLEELVIVNGQSPDGFTLEQTEFVLRSHLRRGSDRDRLLVVNWTKEYQKACDRESLS